MPTNIEWKARLRDLERTRTLVENLRPESHEDFDQVDTFFNAPSGYLKLRQFSPTRGELVSYQRPVQDGAKASRFELFPTDQPDLLRCVLTHSLGVRGEVRKHRHCYRLGQARIHLDRVEGLGTFLEVEVLLAADDPDERGTDLAERLRRAADS